MKEPLHIGKPAWLKSKIPTGSTFFNIKRDLRKKSLYTVCEEAKCPNIAECWEAGTATFMILGDTCTRACRFCNVKTGNPNGWLDPDEGDKVADSIAMMGLKFAVITMVDRDDLEDGGAGQIAKILDRIHERCPQTKIEFLSGDLKGDPNQLRTVLSARPDVFAHNIETVERLSPRVRDRRADYRYSLDVLYRAKQVAEYQVFTKSALMLGLGEADEDVEAALQDLREAQVDFLTIGQYMRPTKRHLSIKRFVHPDEFARWERRAYELGFRSVASGPLVRSSYKARDFYELATKPSEA